jgi:AcrR family transcriptional regulator
MVVADEQGLEELSMRAVAERVGLTPMALYPHVGGKAALLDAMVGRLLKSLLPPESAEGDSGDDEDAANWSDHLDVFAHAARKLALSHPWGAELLFSRPSVAPDAVRLVDHLYTVLLDAGVPPPDVPRLERLVSTFILGYAASEAGGRFRERSLDIRGRREELPSHTLLAAWLERPVDWDAEFQADLDDLRSLIESIAARPRRSADRS